MTQIIVTGANVREALVNERIACLQHAAEMEPLKQEAEANDSENNLHNVESTRK